MEATPKTPFDYRKPDDRLIPLIQEVRDAYNVVWSVLSKLDKSRENAIALTELESSCQWAIKDIVFNK